MIKRKYKPLSKVQRIKGMQKLHPKWTKSKLAKTYKQLYNR